MRCKLCRRCQCGCSGSGFASCCAGRWGTTQTQVCSLFTLILGHLFTVALQAKKILERMCWAYLFRAVVHGCDPPESILEGLVHLLMPFRVANHFFLLGENFWVSRKVLQRRETRMTHLKGKKAFGNVVLLRQCETKCCPSAL